MYVVGTIRSDTFCFSSRICLTFCSTWDFSSIICTAFSTFFDFFYHGFLSLFWTYGVTLCLDLHLEIDNEGRLKKELYAKRGDCSFPIVNFSFLCSNIPAAPAYRVYISQLIRYARACISYHDFLDRGLLLTTKLLNHEFQMLKLKSSLRTFNRRHHELVDRYGITVSQMISDMFLMS